MAHCYSVYRDDSVKLPLRSVIEEFGTSISDDNMRNVCWFAEASGHFFAYDWIGRFDNEDDAVKACNGYPANSYIQQEGTEQYLVIDFAFVEEEMRDDEDELTETLNTIATKCKGITI